MSIFFFDIFCGTGYCLPSAAKRTVSALWVGFPYFAVLRGSSHPADGTKGTPIPAALFYAKVLPCFPFPSSAFLTFFLHYYPGKMHLLFSYVPTPKIFLSVTPKPEFWLLYIEKYCAEFILVSSFRDSESTFVARACGCGVAVRNDSSE